MKVFLKFIYCAYYGIKIVLLHWLVCHDTLCMIKCFQLLCLLMVTMNHIFSGFFFPLCVCSHAFLKSFHITFSFFLTKRNILHGNNKCKHSFSLFFFKILTQKISCSYWLFMGVKRNRIVHGRYRLKIQWLHSLHISCLSLKSYFGFCMK